MQTTIRQVISMAGTGLHSGRPVRLVLRPAFAGHGIWFRRSDVKGTDNLVPAAYEQVDDVQLCTRISNAAGTTISTVEHLMAALSGCGVTNLMVELDGPEVPIMDGSARRFVQAILKAGIRLLDAPQPVLRVLKPVSVTVGGAWAELAPAPGLEIDFSIDFPDAAIGRQSRRMTMANGAFVHDLADSRTFCRAEDVGAMQAQGLALGGSYDNAIVVAGAEVLTPGGFRHDDECVRHKMLDALGDLSLAGLPILGRYTGMRAGHAVTNQLLRRLFATPGAFEIIDATPEILARLPGSGLGRDDLSGAA